MPKLPQLLSVLRDLHLLSFLSFPYFLKENQPINYNKNPCMASYRAISLLLWIHHSETRHGGGLEGLPFNHRLTHERFRPMRAFKHHSGSATRLSGWFQKPLQIISPSSLNSKSKHLFFYHYFSCDTSFLSPKVALFSLTSWAQIRFQSSSHTPQFLATYLEPSFLE